MMEEDVLRNHINLVVTDNLKLVSVENNEDDMMDRIYDFLSHQINLYLVSVDARHAYYMDVPNDYDQFGEMNSFQRMIIPANVKKIVVKGDWLFYNVNFSEDDPDLKFLKENHIIDEHTNTYYHTALGRVLGFIQPWIYPRKKDEENLCFNYSFSLDQYNIAGIPITGELCNNLGGETVLEGYKKFQRFDQAIKQLFPHSRVDLNITSILL